MSGRIKDWSKGIGSGGGYFCGKGPSFGEGEFIKLWANVRGDYLVLSRRNPNICSGECDYTNREFETKNSVFLRLSLKKLNLG